MSAALILLGLAIAANLYAGLKLAGVSRARCASVALLGSALALLLCDSWVAHWAALDGQLLRAICGG